MSDQTPVETPSPWSAVISRLEAELERCDELRRGWKRDAEIAQAEARGLVDGVKYWSERAQTADVKLARVKALAEWSAADYPETVLREILRVVVFGPDDEKPPQA